jgi:lipid II:glycine glycyltransferase (peptidoglycan interpeptide bridge formation enzyme)
MIVDKKNFSREIQTFSDKNIWQSEKWWNFQNSIWKEVFSLWWKNWISLWIKQNLPFWQNYLHIQKWPLWEFSDDFFENLKKLWEEEKSFFIKISPLKKINYTWFFLNSRKNTFPAKTLKLNLEKSEDEILMQMKQKWRYNIRLSQKKWVEIKNLDNSKKTAQIFYNLTQETTERDWFSWHSLEVYEKMLENLWENVKVFVAIFQEKIISAGIFTFYWNEVIYYYWASSNEFRNLMAPYLLQWEAIKFAKKKWFKLFDFLWISENEKDLAWKWITNFKKKFWGFEVCEEKEIEIPLNYFKYFLYRFVNLFR